MKCMDPGCVVLGMSAETFWDGVEGARKLHESLLERTGGIPAFANAKIALSALQLKGWALLAG